MLNLNEDNKTPIKEVVAKAQIKKINKLGTILKSKVPIWELNIKTNKLILAEYEASTTKGTADKLIIKDNCIYYKALNRENALRKIKNGTIFFHTVKHLQ